MGSPPTEPRLYAEPPDISHIVIEDDEPVDSLYAEKQARLLTEPLYASWSGPPPRGPQVVDDDGDASSQNDPERRSFLATINVGVFGTPHDPPLVPDVLLSADVTVHPDFQREKRHATYFIWEMGKPPDVVIEVVSNREGGELGKRMRGYERWRVSYYVVWDPMRYLGGPELRAFKLEVTGYLPLSPTRFPTLGLSLAPWEGVFETARARWLRWFDARNQLIPTGAERAEAESARAEAESARADAERARAEVERARADRLVARLKELGLNDEGDATEK